MKHSQNIIAAVEILEQAKVEAGKKLAAVPDLKIRSDNVLDRLIGGLRHAAGVVVPSSSGGYNRTEPLKSIAGRPLPEAPKASAEVVTPTNEEVDDFQAAVKNAYDEFLTVSVDEARERFGDDVIRGVAVMAGLEVTSTNPKTVSKTLIKKIQDAIVFLNEKEEAKRATGN